MRIVRSETSKKERTKKGYGNDPSIEVLPDKQIEKYHNSDKAVLICEIRPLGGFEYKQGMCEHCKTEIQYRPYNEPFKHKICTNCASIMEELENK